jgi:hypothetical protein
MKIRVFTAFLIIICCQLSFSQVFQADEWCSNFPDLPGNGPIWGHASCVLGDTIYLAGGSTTGTPSTIFYKYSIHGNMWITSSSLPVPKAGGDLVACSGKIYI